MLDVILAPPPQVQMGPPPDSGTSLHQDAAKQAEPPHAEAPAKVSGPAPSDLFDLSELLRLFLGFDV